MTRVLLQKSPLRMMDGPQSIRDAYAAVNNNFQQIKPGMRPAYLNITGQGSVDVQNLIDQTNRGFEDISGPPGPKYPPVQVPRAIMISNARAGLHYFCREADKNFDKAWKYYKPDKPDKPDMPPAVPA